MDSLLPVSVIVPTRNCKKELEIHLEKLDYLWNSVPEIICVDGSSTDGTLEVLEKFCKNNPKTKLLKLPPGLYEGWNSAVRQSTQKYVYFSTIGDSIYQGGLESLYVVAERENVDVVISPPLMLNSEKKRLLKKWPIHHICQNLENSSSLKLNREQIILSLNCFIPSSLLGSSASNIYLKNYLIAHPFPTEFGHAGDTAWGIINCLDIKIALLVKTIAEFQGGWDVEEKDAKNQKDFYLNLCHLSQKILRNYNQAYIQGFICSILDNKLELWNWLASQAEMAKNYQEILEYNRQLADELNKKFPDRVYHFIKKICHSRKRSNF